MPFSQVDICNKALTKIGAARIVSLSDDVRQARSLSAIWDMTRDTELAAHPWTFAIKRVAIPALSTAPAFGWARAFPVPSDFLRAVEVGEDWVLYLPNETGPFFDLEQSPDGSGLAILCDEASPLSLRYISRAENPGLFPALFAEALACRLAAELALESSDSQQDRKGAWDEYGLAISNARRANAIERPPQRPVEDTWSLALRNAAG